MEEVMVVEVMECRVVLVAQVVGMLVMVHHTLL
jgi:hypothetical protein